jgi:hypothetical protein
VKRPWECFRRAGLTAVLTAVLADRALSNRSAQRFIDARSRPARPLRVEVGIDAQRDARSLWGSVAEALATVRERDGYVNCHKTLTPGQPGAVCRGSNDAHEGLLMRLARAEGIGVREVTEAEVLAEGVASLERG